MKLNSYVPALGLLVFLVGHTLALQAQTEGAKIEFQQSTHDFGDINPGDVVSYTFVFKNSGDVPLTITDVRTTCGCTAPYWPKEPISPGQTDHIKVTFNSAGKMGQQHKVVTIESNAINPTATVAITTNILSENNY